MLKFKQIKGGTELVNDVEKLKNQLSIQEIEEVIETPSNTIELSNTPIIEQGICLDINGISYSNLKHFTYDETTNSIEWQVNEFNIDENDFVVAKYYISQTL